MTLGLFRAVFDAVGEDIIDTRGDIDAGLLLGLIERGPHGRDDSTAWLRLVGQWARRRSQRVGWSAADAMTAR